MAKKDLDFNDLDLSVFFGTNDANLEYIRTFFPKIKIIARGNTIKLVGEDKDIAYFEKKLAVLTAFFEKFNRLNKDDITKIMDAKTIDIEDIFFQDKNTLIYGKNGKPIRAKTPAQKKMTEEFFKNDLVFAIGPAGTGKTYMAIALAIKALKERLTQRIILSRPAVEAGEKLGFLPGDFKNKLDPYLQALYDALDDILPPNKLSILMNDRIVQIAPLAYMRGRTLSNAIVILDEAQNTTVNQLKMFLTRMGMYSKFIITGDITQIDLEKHKKSGLVHATEKLKDIEGISFVQFSERDVVRHPLVKKIIRKFD